jgi:FixJ family two-component response regulator
VYNLQIYRLKLGHSIRPHPRRLSLEDCRILAGGEHGVVRGPVVQRGENPRIPLNLHWKLHMFTDVPKATAVCIVDDDEAICGLLSEFVGAWGYTPQIVTADRIRSDWYVALDADIYLMDLHMPGVYGLDLIPQVLKYHPDSRIIIITGYADKESAIKALRLGAFDFLEKPFEREILHHTILRAMESAQKERDLKNLVTDLRQSQSELLAHKERLEHVNERLIETNKAFTALARSMDFEREQMEKRIAAKIDSVILPILDRLIKEEELAKYSMELDVLARLLGDLTTGASTETKLALKLSPTELRVASLIKSGMSTDDIAEHLFISPSTVRKHRKNIRKKLRLNNSHYNLRHYLIAKTPGNTNS